HCPGCLIPAAAAAFWMFSTTGRIAFVSVPMTLSSFSYMLRSELKMPGSPPVNQVTSASHRFANSCAFGSAESVPASISAITAANRSLHSCGRCSGAPKAITALAHKLARIVYNLVRYGLAYVQQTEAAYTEQVRERLEKQLRRRARELGYELKKIEPLPAPT